MQPKKEKRQRRHKRVRAKISGTAKVPRLCVFRSSKHIYCQLIDDEKGQTIAAASDMELERSRDQEIKRSRDREIRRTGKVAMAFEVGKLITQKALEKKIKKIVFDRGGYKYHGRVKALAEGAREAGLKF